MCSAIEAASLLKNNKWYLKLKTADRTYLLSADSETEMNEWLKALRAAQDEVKAESTSKAVSSNATRTDGNSCDSEVLFSIAIQIGYSSDRSFLIRLVPTKPVLSQKILKHCT